MDEQPTSRRVSLDIKVSELNEFAHWSGLHRAAPDRVSTLLKLELYLHHKVEGVTDITPRIADQIDILEGRRPARGMKGPDQFKHLPLRGLWKAHYLRHAREAVPINILHEVRRKGNRADAYLAEVIENRPEDRVGTDFTLEEVEKLIGDYAAKVGELFESRQERGALTGEWLVFAKHEGQNYYLALGVHSEDVVTAQVGDGERRPGQLRAKHDR